ncbi:preprotein translocase subunit SecE [Candidatus Wolfebacteria bacterium]|nr:MAG: preprotein translocase subunit SecE [Candidatus Wolfebacteria bacterium]
MKISEFFKGIKGELKHVNWPTRNEALLFTAIVIVIAFAIAYYLGFFDFIFSLALERIV